MSSGVAYGAKRDQVFLGVVAGMATKLAVVNLQIRAAPATLASPAIAAQHLFL
jgi:hypothetical protein